MPGSRTTISARIDAVGEITSSLVPRNGRRPEAHFHEIAEAVVKEWVRRKAEQTQAETPTSWFKRNLYRLIKAYVDAGHAAIFLSMAKRSGRAQVGLKRIEDNPFKLALFGMWTDNESLTRHQQKTFGDQMLYAYKHDVPPEHLIGFVGVAGSPSRISQKLRDGAREPGFPLA